MENVLKKYKDKKVFITGHTGFKGSWLTFLLDQYGAYTKGYSLAPQTNPSLYLNISFSNKHSSVYSDINDCHSLRKEITSFKPDFIFHLAAQSLVLKSYDNPEETFETNFNGTLNLLEILRELNLLCTALFITTDKVYENNELNIAFKENDKLGGKDPYSASKAASEILIYSYLTSFFNNSKTCISSVRAGNVIGGGDWSEKRLIPDFVRAIYENKPLEIRNPNATRPWQHVLEPLLGYLNLAIYISEKPSRHHGAWNFGPEKGDVKTVDEIIEIAQQLNFEVKVNKLKKYKLKKEAKYLSLDIEKANKELNWFPKWNSKEAILHTLNWYHKFYNGESANILMKGDFKKYNAG